MTRTAAPASVSVEDAWKAKIAKLRTRAPGETFLTIPDPEALANLDAKRQAYLKARSDARVTLPDAGSMSSVEIEAFLGDHPKVKTAHRALEKAVTVAQDAEVTFHFRALPPDVYDGLQGLHEPTEEQVEKGMVYNPDTYVPALIATSSVMPLTEDEVVGLIAPAPLADGTVLPPAFNLGDVTAMVQAIRDINERPRMMLGKGSRPTPD